MNQSFGKQIGNQLASLSSGGAQLAELQSAAVQRERQRMRGILNAPEAKGRREFAMALALESDLSPDAARKLLATTPAGGEATDAFSAHLRRMGGLVGSESSSLQAQIDETVRLAKTLQVPQSLL